jgi:hypothetical protein
VVHEGIFDHPNSLIQAAVYLKEYREVNEKEKLLVGSMEVGEIFSGDLHLRKFSKSTGMPPLIPPTDRWVSTSL